MFEADLILLVFSHDLLTIKMLSLYEQRLDEQILLRLDVMRQESIEFEPVIEYFKDILHVFFKMMRGR